MVNNLASASDDRQSQPIITIFLVDDIGAIIKKLKSVLKSYPDLQIIGTATNGYSAIEQIEYLQPDLVLLDLAMPEPDGFQTVKEIARKYPQMEVMILSNTDDLNSIHDACSSGANKYQIKDNIDLKIVDRIRAAYHDSVERLNSSSISGTVEPESNVLEFSRVPPVNAPQTTKNVGAASIVEKRDENPPMPDHADAFSDPAEACTEAEATQTSIEQPHQAELGEDSPSRFTFTTQSTPSKLRDWSESATELIDTVPLPWTRGLLYVLVAFLGISIPWACLYQMNEIGTARGRLEYRGNIKLEADIEGSVAVMKVHIKKGDQVKIGQTIMELDSKNVREQISQNQLKLDGEQQRLNQLTLMQNQIGLGTNAQQQQNQAQLLEKQSQIAQAQQNLSALVANSRNQTTEKLAQLHQAEQNLATRQSSANLQQAEKLTQVRQAQQSEIDAQTSYLIAQNRLKDAQDEVQRYDRLYQTGAVAEVKVKEIESVAQERNQLFSQAVATLEQSKLRVKEQQENYQRLLQQTQSDIAQARLRLKEQQGNYQSTVNQTQANIGQAKLRLTEQQRGSESLAKSGNIAILKTNQQLKEIQNQIVALKSEIDRNRAQSKFLTGQLAKYTIKANTDGTIFELPIGREGAVVQPKQLIAEIAANQTGLIFKGEIPADQSESLRSSTVQKDVKLKFDEFPFESYEIVKGKLIWMAPNSKLAQTTEKPGTASYEIVVQLNQSCVKHEGNCIPLKLGQPATAEVSIRNRRIIDFILDPFKKLGNNSR
jgi:hemolysin D